MRVKNLIPVMMIALMAAVGQSQTNTPTMPATPKHKTATHPKKAGTTAIKAGAKKPVTAVNPMALFDTSMGKLKCELYPKQAPQTVANFIALAQGTKEWTNPQTGVKSKTPLYDNTIFHRVIPNFMIQGGDPIGNGTGDPGYRFDDEVTPELGFDRPGKLAMANSGPNTNGSQFFITEAAYPSLNGHYSIFGQCDEASVDVVKKIARVATDPRNNHPDIDVKLQHVEIVDPAKKPVAAKKPSAAKKTTAKKKTTAPMKPKS